MEQLQARLRWNWYGQRIRQGIEILWQGTWIPVRRYAPNITGQIPSKKIIAETMKTFSIMVGKDISRYELVWPTVEEIEREQEEAIKQIGIVMGNLLKMGGDQLPPKKGFTWKKYMDSLPPSEMN